MQKLAKKLERSLITSLFGGNADPDENDLIVASALFFLLKELNVQIDSNTSSEIEATLRSENVYNKDFLKEIENLKNINS